MGAAGATWRVPQSSSAAMAATMRTLLIQIARSEIKEQTLVVGQKQLPLDDEWIYQAIEVTHRGDTRGNDWYTDVVGLSRYGAAAFPGILTDGSTYVNGT